MLEYEGLDNEDFKEIYLVKDEPAIKAVVAFCEMRMRSAQDAVFKNPLVHEQYVAFTREHEAFRVIRDLLIDPPFDPKELVEDEQ